MKSETPRPKATAPEVEVRILKVATCPSVSGKSQLTYHVACTAESQIVFRIFSNSAGGAFNQDWVSLNAILQAVSKDNKAITSFMLHPLYQGKSVNTPGFLLAVLKNEGLVQPSTTKRRCHEWVDEGRFVAEMQAWAASGKEAKVEDAPAKSRRKAMKGSAEVPAEAHDSKPITVEINSEPQPSEGKPSKRPKVVPKDKGK